MNDSEDYAQIGLDNLDVDLRAKHGNGFGNGEDTVRRAGDGWTLACFMGRGYGCGGQNWGRPGGGGYGDGDGYGRWDGNGVGIGVRS